MRNLLLLLLLANVLYFLWGRFVAEEEDPGIAVVSEENLGPPLMLADATTTAENAGGEAAAGDAPAPAVLHGEAGRSCVSIGPFRENAEAAGALAEFTDDGLRGSVRTTEGDVFVGHWVQIRGIPDRATANDMLATLKAGGLAEAYIVQTEDEGTKISLGLFSELAGAERIELQAESLDLPADISPRMRRQEIFFVDLGLPPGRGAGQMIERYGEERVLLRDAATCPGGSN